MQNWSELWDMAELFTCGDMLFNQTPVEDLTKQVIAREHWLVDAKLIKIVRRNKTPVEDLTKQVIAREHWLVDAKLIWIVRPGWTFHMRNQTPVEDLTQQVRTPQALSRIHYKKKPNCFMKRSWNWFRNFVLQCHFPPRGRPHSTGNCERRLIS